MAKDARLLAAELLGADSGRYRHSAAVADQAAQLAPNLAVAEADQLVAAAWLHDIGYAGQLQVCGFHPLDGARFLRGRDEDALARLVAHHTGSRFEAANRGLLDQLSEYPLPPGHLADALSYCDMTSGPDGQRVTLDERVREIVSRYGSEHLVTRSILAARPALEAAARRATHVA